MSYALKMQVVGRVQGVGFRYCAQQKASSLRLNGWVRNERDGSVMIHVEGEKQHVESFRNWLKVGPPGAHVESVNSRDTQAMGFNRGFKIEY